MKAEKQLTRLTTEVEARFGKFTVLKTEMDALAKELTNLGVRLGDPLHLYRPPIDLAFIEQVQEALKGGGKNVKQLQKALGIFDYGEMTKKRKALVAAGVTKETENFHGTNATFIELAEDDATDSVADDATGGGEASATDDQSEEAAAPQPEPPRASTKAAAKK